MADAAQFTLKLIDKVRGPARMINKALGKTRRLFDKLNRSVLGHGPGRDALGRFTSSGKGLIGVLHRMKRGLMGNRNAGSAMMDVFKGNLLARGAEGLLRLGARAAAGAAEFVTFGQNQRLAFHQLAKHGASGAKIFQHTRDLAKEFGLDVKDTSASYAKFLALQFNPKEADKLIKMGADLRVLGNDAEGVKGIFTALGQIKSKDRLQAEEMLQLAERGILQALVWEQIGKAMGGKTVDEVRKLQEQGKVTADIALPAIEQAINVKLGQDALGEAGKKFADSTISGAMGRMKARGQDLALTLAERFEGGATKFINKASDKIFGFIDSPKGQKFLDRLALGFENAGKALEKALPFVESFFSGFGSGAGEALKLFGEALDPFFKAMSSGDGKTAHAILKSMGKTFGAIAVTAGMAAGAFLAVNAGVAVIANALIHSGMAMVTGFLDPLKKMVGDVILWWDDLSAIWSAKGLSLSEKAMAIGKQVVMGLVNGLKSLAMLPVEQVQSMAGGVMSALRKVFRTGSPSRATMEVGEDVGRGLPIGLERQVSAAERAVQKYYGPGSKVMGAWNDVAIPQPNYGETISAFAGGGDSAAAGVAGSGVTIQFGDIVIHPPRGADSPEDYGAAARRGIRRELDLIFTELELQE